MLDTVQDSQYCREVTLILQILLWSSKTLSLEACNDAIVVQPEKQPGFSADDRFFDTRRLVDICSGLVVTVWSNKGFMDFQYLQLAHASVREYLLSEKVIKPFHLRLEESIARASLVSMCHTYFFCVDWCTRGKTRREIDQEFPLADWATSTWPAHARFLEAIDDDGLASVLDFLQRVPEGFFKYSMALSGWADETHSYPLYFTAFVGLQHSLACLVQSEVEACGSGPQPEDKSPVSWPDDHDECACRYVTLVRGPNTLQSRLDASLVVASVKGHDQIVQELLVRGAWPNATLLQGFDRTYAAWHLASMMGHTKVVTLLIKSGAFVPSHYRYALCRALESGDTEALERITDLALELFRRCLYPRRRVGSVDGSTFTRVQNKLS